MNKNIFKALTIISTLFLLSNEIGAQNIINIINNIQWDASPSQIIISYGLPDYINGTEYINNKFNTKLLWSNTNETNNIIIQNKNEIEEILKNYNNISIYYSNINILGLKAHFKLDFENNEFHLAWIDIDIKDKSKLEIIEMYYIIEEYLIELYGQINDLQEDAVGKTSEWNLNDTYIRLQFYFLDNNRLDWNYLKILLSYKRKK